MSTKQLTGLGNYEIEARRLETIDIEGESVVLATGIALRKVDDDPGESPALDPGANPEPDPPPADILPIEGNRQAYSLLYVYEKDAPPLDVALDLSLVRKLEGGEEVWMIVAKSYDGADSWKKPTSKKIWRDPDVTRPIEISGNVEGDKLRLVVNGRQPYTALQLPAGGFRGNVEGGKEGSLPEHPGLWPGASAEVAFDGVPHGIIARGQWLRLPAGIKSGDVESFSIRFDPGVASAPGVDAGEYGNPGDEVDLKALVMADLEAVPKMRSKGVSGETGAGFIGDWRHFQLAMLERDRWPVPLGATATRSYVQQHRPDSIIGTAVQMIQRMTDPQDKLAYLLAILRWQGEAATFTREDAHAAVGIYNEPAGVNDWLKKAEAYAVAGLSGIRRARDAVKVGQGLPTDTALGAAGDLREASKAIGKAMKVS